MNPECLKVTIKGPLDEIASVVQQLAWFAASFTLPNSQVITMSTATFCKAGQGLGFERRPRTTNSDTLVDSDTASPYWHRLLNRHVLAQGFPISGRAEEEGVEIPYPLMVDLLGRSTELRGPDKKHLWIGDRLVLYPSKYVDGQLQCYCVDKAENVPQHARPLDLTGVKELSPQRTFLG